MNVGKIINIPYLEDETRDELAAQVFIPGQYSPLYKYGVLFVFDGLDYLSKGRLQSQIERDFGDRLPFLIALLPIHEALRESAYHPEGSKHVMHLHAIAKNLVRTLESQFTLVPFGPARGLLGSSLGASMAFSLATTYPTRFRYLAMQSPFLSTAQKTHLSLMNQSSLIGCDADLYVGEEERSGRMQSGVIHDFYQDAKEYETALKTAGCHTHLHERKGDHTWGAWQDDLPHILKQFANKLTLHEERS